LSKIYIFCVKHDENLLALYQESYFLGFECVAIYFKDIKDDKNFKSIMDTIGVNDYIIILHYPFGSDSLNNFISHFNYKKCLNSKAFQQTHIGNKLYQQNQVFQSDQSIAIATYPKSHFTRELPLPLIAKPWGGSCGQGVKLITDYNSLKDLSNNYIIQPYIPNDGDWRVVVVKGEPISAIKRLGKIDQPTNNIATGSFAVAETNEKTLKEIYRIATIASHSMSFDYVGVDVIKHIENDQYYFLETNERPTFETSQILTGTNIAKQIILTLVE
jgi:glutathione synthase/RimK-type ligase-like ATP-grasp enzyme